MKTTTRIVGLVICLTLLIGMVSYALSTHYSVYFSSLGSKITEFHNNQYGSTKYEALNHTISGEPVVTAYNMYGTILTRDIQNTTGGTAYAVITIPVSTSYVTHYYSEFIGAK